jgi:hypothetical protein
MDHAAVLQTDQPPGTGCNIVLVSDKDNGNALLAIELLKNRHDFTAGLSIEIASGLVGKYKLWIVDQRTADGNALLLPAGQLIGLIRCEFPQASLMQ